MATSMASSVPQKHRALVLKSTKDPYDMSVVLQESQHAGHGSLVARVLAAGVLTYAARVYSGRKPYTYPEPFVPGSSAICRVTETGPDTTLLKPGQLIFFDCFIAGRDDDTALILHGLSDGFTAASVGLMEREWRDSTYAEYAKLPLENCFPLDEARLTGSPTNGGLGYTVNDLLYLFTISVPFGGLRDIDIKAGDKVVIAPATGTFGSAAVVAALAMGARVIVMGRDTDTLEQLKPLSSDGRVRVVQNTGDVDADVKTLTKDGPIDAFFDISPGRAFNSPHYKSCILSLKRGGRVSLMAAHEELTLPTQTIMLNDITVKGKWMYTKKDMTVMINLAEAGYIKLGEAAGVKTVGAFPLEKFADAFQMAADIHGPCMQVAICP